MHFTALEILQKIARQNQEDRSGGEFNGNKTITDFHSLFRWLTGEAALVNFQQKKKKISKVVTKTKKNRNKRCSTATQLLGGDRSSLITPQLLQRVERVQQIVRAK